MAQVIEQLGRDHRNLRLLLDIVEEEMDAYREGRVPDFDLLRMIAEYTLTLFTTQGRMWFSSASSCAISEPRQSSATWSRITEGSPN